MRNYQSQSGAGLLGFTLISLPVLLLGLGALELAYWLSLSQAINVAFMQAARAGITTHARPISIADAFEQNLKLAYPNRHTIPRLLQQQKQALGLPWQIKIISPMPGSFTDHQYTHGPKLPGEIARINNLYQDLQQLSNLEKGWPNGNGPVSAQNIYQANTLILELSWPHRPALALIGNIMASLTPADSDNKYIMQAGYLPIKRKLTFVMQSDPVLWPELADGRVIYAGSSQDYKSYGLANICLHTDINCTNSNVANNHHEQTAPEPNSSGGTGQANTDSNLDAPIAQVPSDSSGVPADNSADLYDGCDLAY